LQITIINWDKYNPKRAQRTYTWLRLNNDIFFSPDIFGLKLEEKAVWIFLLCQASRKNSGVINLTPDFIAHSLNTKTSKISQALKTFEKIQLITTNALSLPPALHFATPTDRQTDERTNETNERDGRTQSPAALPPLAEIWNENCGQLSQVKVCNPERRRKCKSRWLEVPGPNDYWIEVVRKLAASDFCNGKNDRGWTADFTFLLKPDTHIKVMEGKYKNRAASGRAQRISDNNMNLLDRVKKGELL